MLLDEGQFRRLYDERFLQAHYKRKVIRRAVEQSRALRYPDSPSDTEPEVTFYKKIMFLNTVLQIPRQKLRRPLRKRRPPPVCIAKTDEKCVEKIVEGIPVISFASIKEYKGIV